MSETETGTEVALSPASNFVSITADKSLLQEVIRENVGADLNIFDLDKLGIPSGGGVNWTVHTMEGDQIVKHVDGIIIYSQDIRSYWKESFEDNPGQPPDCQSLDCIEGEGEPGGDCVKCPLSKFGSAEKGEGQACSQSRRMFFLTENGLLPIMLVCPPTSLKNARKYFIRMASYNVPYYTVVTRLKLTEDKNATGVKYSKVTFESIGKLSDHEVARIKSYRDDINPALGAIPIDGDYADNTGAEERS